MQANNQRVYLNKISLVINQVTLNTPGYYTLVWRKGKKYAETTQFQIDENTKPVNINQTLNMNLKLYKMNNNTYRPKNSHLYLMMSTKDQSQQIWSEQIDVHQYEQEYEPKLLNIKGKSPNYKNIHGKISIQINRIEIMQLQNFNKFSAQIQQSSTETKTFIKNIVSSNSKMITNAEYLTMQNQLQDLRYLVDKLKSDRNTAMTKNKQLSEQLNTLKKQIRQQMEKLQQYYINKLQIRQSIYTEEMQNLITTYNQNSQINIKILKQCLNQNNNLYTQIDELKLTHDLQLEQQKILHNSQLQKKQDELTKQRNRVQDCEKQNNQLVIRNRTLKKQCDHYKKLYEKQSMQHEQVEKEWVKKHKQNIQALNNTQDQLKASKLRQQQLQQEIQQKRQQINKLEEQIRANKKQLHNYYQKQLNSQTQIDTLNATIKQLQTQLKILQNQIQQANQVQNKLRQNIDKLTTQKYEDQQSFNKEINNLKEHYQNESKYLQNLIDEANHNTQIKQNQKMEIINEATLQKDQLNRQIDQKEQQIQDLKTQIQDDVFQMRKRQDQLVLCQDRLSQLEQIVQHQRQQYQKKQYQDQKIMNDIIKQKEQHCQHLLDNLTNRLQEQVKQTNQMRQDYQNKLQQERDQILAQIRMRDQLQSDKNNLQIDIKYYQRITEDLKKIITEYDEFLDQGLKELLQGKQDEINIRGDTKKGGMKNMIETIVSLAKKQTQKQRQSNISSKQDSSSTGKIVNPLFNIIGQSMGTQKKQQQQKDPQKKQQQKDDIVKPEQILKTIFNMTRNKNQTLVSKIDNMKLQIQNGKSREIQLMATIQQMHQDNEYKQKRITLMQQQINILQQDKRDLQIQIQQLKMEYEQKKNNTQFYSISETKGKMSGQLGTSSRDDFKFGNNRNTNRNNGDGIEGSEKLVQKKFKNQERKRRYSRDGGSPLFLNKNFMIDEEQSKLEQLQIKQNQCEGDISQNRSRITTTQGPKLNKQITILSSQHDYQQHYGQLQDGYQNSQQIEQPKIRINKNRQQLQKQDNNRLYETDRRMQIDDNFDNRGQMYETNDNFSLGLTENLKQSLKNSQQQIRALKEKIGSLQKQLRTKQLQLKQRNQQLQANEIKTKDLFNQLSVTQQQLYKKTSDTPVKKSQQKQQNNQLRMDIQKLTNNLQKQMDAYNKIQQQLQLYKDNNNNNKNNNNNNKNNNNNNNSNNNNKNNNNYNRYTNIDISRILQQQVQDLHHKIIQLTKTNNTLQIQKQTLNSQLGHLTTKTAQLQKTKHRLQCQITSHQNQQNQQQYNINKLKNTLQNKQYQLNKYIAQKSGYQTKINEVQHRCSQKQMEYRSFMDQKYRIQRQLQQKQYQLVSMQKQLNKLNNKYKQLQQNKYIKNTSQNRQKQRILQQNTKKTKQINQLQYQISNLQHNLQKQQKHAQTKHQQQKSQFNHKLHSYQQELYNIKQILKQNETQIDYIKKQNYDLVGQLEQLAHSLEQSQKYRNKIQQLLAHSQHINQQLQFKVHQIDNKNKQLVAQFQQISHKYQHIQADFNKQKQYNIKITHKLTEMEALNQKYIYQINAYKNTITNYQQQANIKQHILKQNKQLKNNNQQLSQQLLTLTHQYNTYQQTHIYTHSQLQQLLQQLKSNYQQQLQKQSQQITHQLQSKHQQQQHTNQQQLLNLYKQNTKLGTQLHLKEEELMQANQNLIELQNMKHKYENIKQQLSVVKNKNVLIESDNCSMRKQLGACEQIMSKYERQLQQLKQQFKLIDRKLIRTQKQLQHTKQKQKQYQNKIHILQQQLNLTKQHKNQANEELASQSQHLQAKLLSLQLQNNRIKDRQANMLQEYRSKLNKLEKTCKQVQLVNTKLGKDLQNQQSKLKGEKQRALKLIRDQLQLSKQQCKTLTNALSTLKLQNNQLCVELANIREQLTQDQQLYLLQINKLKNNIHDNQQVYTLNMNNLQQELAALNHQLTQQRINKNNNRSTYGLHNSGMSESDRNRWEQKLRKRDQKISDLSMKILKYEESLNDRDSIGQDKYNIQKYKKLCEQLHLKLKQQTNTHNQQLQKHYKNQQNLRKIILNQNNNIQQLKLKLQHNTLQQQSIVYQLNTYKTLYHNLQIQLDNRKNIIHQQMINKQSIDEQIELRNKTIRELEQQNVEIGVRVDIAENRLSKKQEQIQKIKQLYQKTLEKIKRLQQDKCQSQYRNQVCNNINDEPSNKSVLYQREILQIKHTHNQQLNRIKKQTQIEIQQLKQQLTDLKLQNKKLMKQMMAVSHKIKEYEYLEQLCLQRNQINPIQLIEGYQTQTQNYFKLNNQLKQQMQQMRFMLERKQMDYEQEHQNYIAIQMKMQDYQMMSQQVQTLQKICDKLQQQKKRSNFQYEAIVLKLDNLIQYEPMHETLKQKLIEILTVKQYDRV